MRKKQILDHWRELTPNQPLRPSIVPYKHEGSTYDEDGIRITGSEAFIAGVVQRVAGPPDATPAWLVQLLRASASARRRSGHGEPDGVGACRSAGVGERRLLE